MSKIMFGSKIFVWSIVIVNVIIRNLESNLVYLNHLLINFYTKFYTIERANCWELLGVFCFW